MEMMTNYNSFYAFDQIAGQYRGQALNYDRYLDDVAEQERPDEDEEKEFARTDDESLPTGNKLL